jgi:SAM-dependent methyltransferase
METSAAAVAPPQSVKRFRAARRRVMPAMGTPGYMKQLIKRIPVVGELARRAHSYLASFREPSEPFPGSAQYWERRYAAGGDSGPGSYSKMAAFKAEILNAFVHDHSVRSVVEFGCGDGEQLSLAEYPNYAGLDISDTTIAKCRERFAADPTKTFSMVTDYKGEKADLALSLDVICHLVENAAFETYMRTLFGASTRYVIIYSSDTTKNRHRQAKHVRHRRFSRWVGRNAPGWRLIQHIPNRYPFNGDYMTSSFASFFIYEKV